MKTSRLQLTALAFLLAGFSTFAAATLGDANAWQQLLEKEWLLEAQLHTEGQQAATLSTRDDAAGGCDGVTNGKWGFHTAEDNHPWWQVDLGKVFPLSQVRVWNRAESEDIAARAANFQILLSNDGAEWHEAYRHNGRVFYGYRMPDRSPLVVRLTDTAARFVRIQLPARTFLHLDEVEVIGKSGGNLALRKPADQSSLSQWSTAHARNDRPVDWVAETRRVLANCERMLSGPGVLPLLAGEGRGEGEPRSLLKNSRALMKQLSLLKRRLSTLPANASAQSLYLESRAQQRQFALASPLLDFDALLFTKRVPGSYSHMSDQNYGWWSRPGGGIYILRGLKNGPATTSARGIGASNNDPAAGDVIPRAECLTDAAFKEPGSFMRPALSFDAKKILFAWCKHYPELAKEKDKLNKANVPEDAFYHVFEMNADGSGVRRLTHGKYDNFDARYLPDGRIVFLSTRRGQFLQVGKASAAATLAKNDLPDCYVRCGGDASRPVAVYTLHTMNADGGDLTPISPFEMFEWEPSVARDGTILYSRWDYVDRDNMPYMSLWSINPDGINARLIYGNYTKAPHCTFEPRAIPGSDKIIFTASGHHSQTMGSLVLLNPAVGTEGEAPITRLTPETPFPEIEGWPRAFYANPWPLSERTHLVAWGVEEEMREGKERPKNGMGLYLFNTDSGLELLYRDPEISSMYPIPLKPQPRPPVIASNVKWDGPQEGRFLVADVTRGLKTVQRGDVKALRIIAIPAKTQPWMNQPVMGLTHDDPGKAVLGTVPVEADGSAYFRVPSGVAFFFQALDARGMAVQTMRSATHVQPGQTLSCTGCHDPRKDTPPPSASPLASLREPSKITVGPEGSWTMRFDKLIQPVLDAQCVSCHNPKSDDVEAAKFDLTPEHAYKSLTLAGKPSLNDLVVSAYRDGVSTEGHNPAIQSAVLRKLADPAGHAGVKLDRANLDRFVTWMDTYAQRTGTFSPEQEQELEHLRRAWAELLIEPPARLTAASKPD
ncbi:MAG: discoidin domain-containing protein [Verrucomicrobia bacterium]|nr:discoidin domain-containing protein [Verrucomicrobiota bacterium]